jgi:hypothetical protein
VHCWSRDEQRQVVGTGGWRYTSWMARIIRRRGPKTDANTSSTSIGDELQGKYKALTVSCMHRATSCLKHGKNQLVDKRFLLDDCVFPVALHLFDVPICRVVPGGVRACVIIIYAMSSPRTFRKASPRARM